MTQRQNQAAVHAGLGHGQLLASPRLAHKQHFCPLCGQSIVSEDPHAYYASFCSTTLRVCVCVCEEGSGSNNSVRVRVCMRGEGG